MTRHLAKSKLRESFDSDNISAIRPSLEIDSDKTFKKFTFNLQIGQCMGHLDTLKYRKTPKRVNFKTKENAHKGTSIKRDTWHKYKIHED